MKLVFLTILEQIKSPLNYLSIIHLFSDMLFQFLRHRYHSSLLFTYFLTCFSNREKREQTIAKIKFA